MDTKKTKLFAFRKLIFFNSRTIVTNFSQKRSHRLKIRSEMSKYMKVKKKYECGRESEIEEAHICLINNYDKRCILQERIEKGDNIMSKNGYIGCFTRYE